MKSTAKKIGELERNNYEFLKYWLEVDARVLKVATDLMKHMKNEMKRSYTLTKAQTENPKVLGARPRETENPARAYPSLPPDLEETSGTRPNRTVTWVQDTKPTIDKNTNGGANATTKSGEQPPDYS